jgi:hypothetical protein
MVSIKAVSGTSSGLVCEIPEAILLLLINVGFETFAVNISPELSLGDELHHG